MTASSSPLVSVVTPVRNGVRFLAACVACVADEGRHVPLEHLVIDGASTDGTAETLAALALEYPHLRYVSESDRGQSDAMNKGIAMARGPMLGILNVDDFYQPGALARAASELSELPEPSLVIGDCSMWDAEGRLLGVNRPRRLDLVNLLLPGNEDLLPLNPSQYLYHRSLHARIGPYPIDEHFAMDIEFFLSAAAVATLRYVPEVWGNFRLLPDAKTQRDVDSGASAARLERILAKHRDRLPFAQRLRLRLRRSLPWR